MSANEYTPPGDVAVLRGTIEHMMRRFEEAQAAADAKLNGTIAAYDDMQDSRDDLARRLDAILAALGIPESATHAEAIERALCTAQAMDLLAEVFRASAELRFHIKTNTLPRVDQNPSWLRHTEAMRKVEKHLAVRAAAGKEAQS